MLLEIVVYRKRDSSCSDIQLPSSSTCNGNILRNWDEPKCWCNQSYSCFPSSTHFFRTQSSIPSWKTTIYLVAIQPANGIPPKIWYGVAKKKGSPSNQDGKNQIMFGPGKGSAFLNCFSISIFWIRENLILKSKSHHTQYIPLCF